MTMCYEQLPFLAFKITYCVNVLIKFVEQVGKSGAGSNGTTTLDPGQHSITFFGILKYRNILPIHIVFSLSFTNISIKYNNLCLLYT